MLLNYSEKLLNNYCQSHQAFATSRRKMVRPDRLATPTSIKRLRNDNRASYMLVEFMLATGISTTDVEIITIVVIFMIRYMLYNVLF